MASAQGREAGSSDPSRTPLRSEKSLSELFSDLTSDMSQLFRQEVALARTEATDEIGRATRAGSLLVAGGLVAYLTLMFASFALAWLLDEWVHPALAFLIVAAVHGVVATVMLAQGRRRLRDIKMVPEQTVDTLKEDLEWAKAQRS